MSDKDIVMIDAPDLVKRVTVTGWVDAGGRFWGEDERMARYASCTHVACKQCGKPVLKPWTACDDCRIKNDIAIWHAMPKVEWDGNTMLYSDACDRYFQDYDEIVDHLRDMRADDPGAVIEDLRLVVCVPNMARRLNNDFFSDELPEDVDEPPKAIQEAMAAFNEAMSKQPPLSWSPGKQAAIVTINPADLED
ncbi:hypothetical protein [Burkholderia gladioli]|uniref:hypothetical protein n=1 Tax=Burkholderia gladioli TaxID=28095 RepID=UPI00163E76AD|nr:hypothetical protein [Burkholderia gladioli]